MQTKKSSLTPLLTEDSTIGDCLLLIGTIRPVRSTGRAAMDAPQLRGVRLYRDRLPNPLPSVVPSDAIEHGWYMCTEEGAVPRLQFAYQSRRAPEQVLAPALCPLLPSVGFKLWRKGQTTFSIAPKTTATPPSDVWDALVREHLQGGGTTTASTTAVVCHPVPPVG